MIEETTSIVFDSLPPLVVAYLVYTYLLYIAFFKKGKFKGINDLEEAGKLIFLFFGIFALTIPIMFGLIFLSHVMFEIPLPQDLTSDMQAVVFYILVFVFYPYMMKKDAEKRGRKFDIADWFELILSLQVLLILFTIINFIYTKIIANSGASNFFLGVFVFLFLLFIMGIAYLGATIKFFHLRRRSFLTKGALRTIVIGIILSVLALFLYVSFPAS
jgi:hypothetical protein